MLLLFGSLLKHNLVVDCIEGLFTVLLQGLADTPDHLTMMHHYIATLLWASLPPLPSQRNRLMDLHWRALISGNSRHDVHRNSV